MYSQPPLSVTQILAFTNVGQDSTIAAPNLGAFVRLVGCHLAPQVSATAGVIFVVTFRDSTGTIYATLGCSTGGSDDHIPPEPGIAFPINTPVGTGNIIAHYQASVAGPNNALVTLEYVFDGP